MLSLDKFYYEGKLQFYPHKIIKINSKKFIIINTTSAIFEIDEDIENMILYSGKTPFQVEVEVQDRYTSEKLLELFEDLEKNNILKTATNNIDRQLTEKVQVNSLTLMVCQECNLRCSYCYGEGGEYHDRGIMTIETGKKAITFGLENCKDNALSIIFFGGEPLMQFGLIRNWVQFAKEEALKRNIQIGFSVTTNATLITDEIADFFKENRFGVTISIDGCEEDNDKNRFYVNRKGAYQNIMKGVQILQKHGVTVSARGTVTSNNINMLKSWKHLRDLKFNNIHLSPALNLMEESDLGLYIAEQKQMVDYFIKCLKNEDYEDISKMHNIEGFLLRIHYGGIRNTCCGAQVRMIAVDKNGDIYPCHRFVSTKEMCIGNITVGWDNYKMKIIHNELLLDNSTCSLCWARVLCGGGCPFENYMGNSVICKPNSFTCEANQSVLLYIVTKYLELTDEVKESYFNQRQAATQKQRENEALI